MRSLGLALLVLVACTGRNEGTASDSAAVSGAPHRPSDPVANVETIDVRLDSEGGHLSRVYVPVDQNGTREHAILDSGTARTWYRLASGTDFTADAFVSRIGDTTLTIFGRNVPALGETIEGREEIGAIGLDWMSAGPTELDLRNGRLVRYPVGTVLPGVESWPTMTVRRSRGLVHGDVTVDGVTHHVMVDTGAPITLLIGEPRPGDVPRTSHDVLGQSFTVYDGTSTVAIAAEGHAVPVERAPVFQHLTDIGNAIGENIEGLLGLSSMGQGRVIFDLGAGLIRFEP